MARDWRPGTTAERLRARAALTGAMRAFFAAGACCEVVTPALSPYASSEATLSSFRLAEVSGNAALFLRTSPESAMKRLLACGSGDIYQIGPVFRAEEVGRRHLPEFTLLEWYRLGYDHHALMDEVARLLQALDFRRPVAKLTYAALFTRYCGVDPHSVTTAQLAACARAHGVPLAGADGADRALLFDGLYAQVIEPALARAGALFIHDFPCELRAYARLSAGSPPVAERFELVIDGLEIANGYHEIVDAAEQAECFGHDNRLRARRGLRAVAPDEAWLAALRAGLPPCAGVALGVERLHMALCGEPAISALASFACDLGSGNF